ncbi:hypothetical protein AREALGSMS7_01102 [Arenibacter algicola]|uniref:Uncharacterized protein n=1 Tax=Arenibacter algicola TaxID=616991 RepID=A0A221UTD6_9FLAO|nr:hypothetical protein AREALGSMS7_01102 [Arenibacter algicola]
MLIIIQKLNEKMMTIKDASIDIIIRANSEMGSPKMTACFLMFLYTSNCFTIPRLKLDR